MFYSFDEIELTLNLYPIAKLHAKEFAKTITKGKRQL